MWFYHTQVHTNTQTDTSVDTINIYDTRVAENTVLQLITMVLVNYLLSALQLLASGRRASGL